jgi:hypothetical protein
LTRQVIDHAGATHRGPQGFRIPDIAPHEAEPAIMALVAEPVQIVLCATSQERVEDRDVVAIADQAGYQVGSDEARSSRYKNWSLHAKLLSLMSSTAVKWS